LSESRRSVDGKADVAKVCSAESVGIEEAGRVRAARVVQHRKPNTNAKLKNMVIAGEKFDRTGGYGKIRTDLV
jgi:hypothetical protein